MLLLDVEGHKEADIGCILSVGTGQSPATDVNCSTFSLTAPTSINEGISMIRDIINLKNILIEQVAHIVKLWHYPLGSYKNVCPNFTTAILNSPPTEVLGVDFLRYLLCM